MRISEYISLVTAETECFMTGELIRFDMQTKEEKVLYALGDGEPMFFIFMHPSGNYAYI